MDRLGNSGSVFAFGFLLSTGCFLEVKNGGLDVKIRKDKLKRIIEEEVSLFVETAKKKRKKMSDAEARRRNTEQKQAQRKRDTLRWGDESLRQLARGIAEDNNYFDDRGFFTNKEDAKTYSSYFKDGVRRSLVGRTHSPKQDAGRGRYKNRGTGTHKVDGTKKWEENQDGSEEIRFSMSMDELSKVVEDCVSEFIKQFGERHKEEPSVMEDDVKINWQQQCSRRGFRTFAQILAAMNQMSKAASGDLGKG